MVEFKLNISSALDREVSGSQSIKLHYFCSFKETHGTFSQCYKNENICSIVENLNEFMGKMSLDFLKVGDKGVFNRLSLTMHPEREIYINISSP